MQSLLHQERSRPSAWYPIVRILDDTPDDAHGAVLKALGLLLAPLHALDAVAPLFGGHALARNESLSLPHATVDIDIVDLDPDGAVGGACEPTPDLPHQEEEHQKRASKVGLKKAAGFEWGSSDGVQCGVERSDESERVDQDTEV
jgi:hypothetical protein